MILEFVRSISAGGRARKRTILVAYDIAAMVVALIGAFSARLGQIYFPTEPLLISAAAASMAIGIAALFQLRVYHIVLRFFDLRTVSQIFFGAVVAAAAWVMIIYFLRPTMPVGNITIHVPRSVGFIYCGFLFVLLFMGRYLMALTVAFAAGGVRPRLGADARRIAIYGANAAGISLAESVRRDHHLQLIGFIDDEPALHGQLIAGTPIYGPDALDSLVVREEVAEVLLALPKASRAQRLAAIQRLTELNVAVKTVPAPEEIMSGRFTVSDVRPIDVNDLLRRDPVEPLSDLIRDAVDGHCVLVTGAGGSIGSEICRQILRGKPARLILFDHSEYSLFSIEQQLIELLEETPEESRPAIVPVIGSMLNADLVRTTIALHEVDTIYHAAAYKHVPLLETNEIVGVENNVMGTLILARAAAEAGIARFTMVSTDKAVRPESVMGASKRVAELIIQALSEDGCATRMGIVRFGNVLDSSGSVVQRFRNQIRRGGPVTVTHREITRFFMSIPEATQLVLQASAMATCGEVFVLDMGEPIRITELARNMIRLSGMSVRDDDNPNGDIEITFVGLRPGEKLYEELFIGEEAIPTAHPRIRMAKERSIPLPELERQLEALQAAIGRADSAAVRAMLNELIAPEHGVVGQQRLAAVQPEAPATKRTVH
jgi:UDP-N-acetylglucosamine 4,6-dehydratase